MSYAVGQSSFVERGAQLAGISVDAMDRNRVMVAKLHLPFPLLSDPDGALLQHVGIWNAEQKIALPAIVVVDPAGTVRYRYVGEDFADRPGDDAIFAALDGVRSTPAVGQLAPAVAIQVSADQPEAQHKDGGRTPISVADLAVYYRGAFNAAGALKRRFGVRGTFSREALHEIDRYQRVVKSYQDALAKLPAL